MRDALVITAQNRLILRGGEGGNYSLALSDSFDEYTRCVRPFRSPRRGVFIFLTVEESVPALEAAATAS